MLCLWCLVLTSGNNIPSRKTHCSMQHHVHVERVEVCVDKHRKTASGLLLARTRMNKYLHTFVEDIKDQVLTIEIDFTTEWLVPKSANKKRRFLCLLKQTNWLWTTLKNKSSMFTCSIIIHTSPSRSISVSAVLWLWSCVHIDRSPPVFMIERRCIRQNVS